MMLRRCTTTLLALCLGGVAACSAATPSLSPGSPSPTATAPERQPGPSPSVPSSSRSSSPSPSAHVRQGLGAELDIQALDPAVSDQVLEFASDGESIIFSSGAAPDAGADAAPDLWRYVPGPAATPELVWRNPERDHSLVKIGGDRGTLVFVDIPLTGERAWNLWLLPREATDPILLDTHPGDEDVSSLVPSFIVQDEIVVWTAFDRGPSGPVSRLLMADAPAWEPRILEERLAAEAELWLPSLYGGTLVYNEVRYSEDRASDERFVHLTSLGDPEAVPRRLDTSGRATMPVIVDDVVFWKEADPGFNMFNWGKMFRYDLASGEISSVSTWPQEYVNYPSGGGRFVAWWGANSFRFGVYDVERDRARIIASFSEESQESVLRPHVAGDLLVWLHIDTSEEEIPKELRWAWLPFPGADRLDG